MQTLTSAVLQNLSGYHVTYKVEKHFVGLLQTLHEITDCENVVHFTCLIEVIFFILSSKTPNPSLDAC